MTPRLEELLHKREDLLVELMMVNMAIEDILGHPIQTLDDKHKKSLYEAWQGRR